MQCTATRDIPACICGVLTGLTFEKKLLGHGFSFVLVPIDHGDLRAGLTQSMGERSADALPATRHVGHLPVQTHPIEDGAPPRPTENFIVCYFTLTQKRTNHNISRRNQAC